MRSSAVGRSNAVLSRLPGMIRNFNKKQFSKLQLWSKLDSEVQCKISTFEKTQVPNLKAICRCWISAFLMSFLEKQDAFQKKKTKKHSSAGFLKLAADKRRWQPDCNVACHRRGGTKQQRREEATLRNSSRTVKSGIQVSTEVLNNKTSHGTHHVVWVPRLPLELSQHPDAVCKLHGLVQHVLTVHSTLCYGEDVASLEFAGSRICWKSKVKQRTFNSYVSRRRGSY